MAVIEGVSRLVNTLGRLARKIGPRKPRVITGYTQAYAVFVHENLEAQHRVGQAKFLEGPARRFEKQIVGTVRKAIKRGQRFDQALLLGGLFLQRMSQPLVPVDTGALKASAFTRKE